MSKRKPSARGRLARLIGSESASGLVLVLASVVAIVLANSAWAPAYDSIVAWTPRIELFGAKYEASSTTLVNEVLMTLFFFVVGLEVRRELHDGALADPRQARLPLVAALGGMVVPALLYAALNPEGAARQGWGIPMATDIAFALAALSLLGRRIPPSARVLLLALAIIDDIGGVLVIAVFYSGAIVQRWLPLVAIGIVLTLAMKANRVRLPILYLAPAIAVWIGFHHTGVHPTMAGVVMGLLAPPQRSFDGARGAGDASSHRSPSERVQAWFHPWVSWGVLPVFAFVNAGVTVEWPPAESRVAAGVLVGLLLGKPLGILSMCWLAVRLRLAALPTTLRWRDVGVVGVFAGIGFTVALFIAQLALPDPDSLASAKIAILVASALAAVVAIALGRTILARAPPP